MGYTFKAVINNYVLAILKVTYIYFSGIGVSKMLAAATS